MAIDEMTTYIDHWGRLEYEKIIPMTIVPRMPKIVSNDVTLNLDILMFPFFDKTLMRLY